MVTRTWIGGGNNDASNPNDWSPAEVPKPGDTLELQSPGAVTMNISGKVLHGDTLNISTTDPTLNLSNGASVTATEVQDVNAVFNLSGRDRLNLTAGNGTQTTCSNIVNLAANSAWIGTFTLNRQGSLIVNGAGVFINNGASNSGFPAVATINVPIEGRGTISSNWRTEFGSSVGAGQTISTYGIDGTDTVTIDHASEFHGLVDMIGATEIDLLGLAGADSYTFKNDMLKLYSGGKDIYNMRLENSSSFYTGFAVTETAKGVSIYSFYGNETFAGELPVHH